MVYLCDTLQQNLRILILGWTVPLIQCYSQFKWETFFRVKGICDVNHAHKQRARRYAVYNVQSLFIMPVKLVQSE